MRSGFQKRRLGLALAVVFVSGLLMAAGPTRNAGNPDPAKPGQTVEMFSAIKDGLLEVQLVPKDSTQCRINFRNKTDKPLSVKLPEAFAGVPVLGQRGVGAPGGAGIGGRGGGYGGRGGGSYGGYGGGGGNQGFGGGLGGMGMGGMGMGGMGMGGFMNVAPEKVEHLNVPIVCLEHGKPDPKPTVKYEIRPIEAFTNKAGVREVCELLGSGTLPPQHAQRIVQVAAWHLNNDMSWEQLATKQLRFANGTRRPYFGPNEIKAAMQLVSVATNLAEQRKNAEPKPESSSQTTSFSQN